MYSLLVICAYSQCDPTPLKQGVSWMFWLQCLLILLSVIPRAYLSEAEASPDRCLPGTYANSTEDPIECLPCQACQQGQGIASPCGGTNNTVCSDCGNGYFSKLTAEGRKCVECKDCAPQRIETSPCMAVQDSICGGCAVGYFLFIDSEGSECKRCSRCPTDRTVVHWIECAEAGEPVDHQCAPEEWSEESSALLVQLSTSSASHASKVQVEGRTKLPTEHGMFVPMASYEVQTRPPQGKSDAPRKIAIVSMVFTGLTVVVFLCAVGCLSYSCYKEVRKERNYPVQAKDQKSPADIHITHHYSTITHHHSTSQHRTRASLASSPDSAPKYSGVEPWPDTYTDTRDSAHPHITV